MAETEAERRDAHPLLVLMCGRSFSGKSTLARAITDELGGDIVSLDAINEERGLRGGEGIPINEWARTNDEADARAALALAAGRPVVVDDTSSPRFLRDGWRRLAERSSSRFVLVYVNAAESLILERVEANRQAGDRHDARDELLQAHLGSFEPPASDEPHILVDGGGYDVAKVVAAVSRDTSSRVPGPQVVSRDLK
ncbi:ATP-binding protein [Microbacterium sp. STN6]|uniref:AAA family ATPase n=1 Tax=Microbacterium sp. STN6 TaxID=2995588 RepID=UPI002260F910|nr:ATP-binding protein [Microbacterium sp. STN6]MCX7521960.1 ATP-binding protein [Microbacterium sp. STN6]